VRSLLTAAEGSRYAPLFALLVNTGLRRGEALALHWSDVDLDEKLLRVRGTLARVDGELIVTETKTPKSRRAVPPSPPQSDYCETSAPGRRRAATCRVHVEADTVRLHDRAR
jgi:integrase